MLRLLLAIVLMIGGTSFGVVAQGDAAAAVLAVEQVDPPADELAIEIVAAQPAPEHVVLREPSTMQRVAAHAHGARIFRPPRS